jgi:hypothetical protein
MSDDDFPPLRHPLRELFTASLFGVGAIGLIIYAARCVAAFVGGFGVVIIVWWAAAHIEGDVLRGVELPTDWATANCSVIECLYAFNAVLGREAYQ